MNDIKSQKIDFSQIKSFIKGAADKINKAEKVLNIDEQTAFQMAYEAMLRGSLGFMLSYGKRPRSTIGHHKIVIGFVSEKLGKNYKNIISIFNLARRKRNELIYEPDSLITKKELFEILAMSKKYMRIISDDIERRHPQLKLF